VVQLVIGVLSLPLMKLFKPGSDSDIDSPFKEPEYDNMGWFEYSGKLIYYGMGCVLDTAD